MIAAVKLTVALTILPLGDSITDGVPTADGYRAALAQELKDAGISVTYVGSLRSPAGAHEGWSGYTAAELLPPAKAALSRHRPDVVLLHIGTNDLGMGVPLDEIVSNVRRLLELIDERRRRGEKPTHVFLARIIGRNLSWDLGSGGESQNADDEVLRYNERLSALAQERRRAGQPIDVVDLHALVDPRRHLADALHPNEAGYTRIAAGFAAAIRRRYKSRTSSNHR